MPRRTHAHRTCGASTSSATSTARTSLSLAQTRALSSSRSLRTGPSSSKPTTHSPGGGMGMRSWRRSEPRGRRQCPKAGAIAGRRGRVQGPPPMLPRPTYPSLFPQAPWRPCMFVGCGSQGKGPTYGGDRVSTGSAQGRWPSSPSPVHLVDAAPCPTLSPSRPGRLPPLSYLGGNLWSPSVYPDGRWSFELLLPDWTVCLYGGIRTCPGIVCPCPRSPSGGPRSVAPPTAHHGGVGQGRVHHRGARGRPLPGIRPEPAGAARGRAPRPRAPVLAARSAA